MESVLAAVERFLREARSPALLEPGDEMLRLSPDCYTVEMRGSRVTIQAWDRTRNVVRRITAINGESKGRLELTVERFARKPGKMFLLDLATQAASSFGHRNKRLVFRERVRLYLRRQFPDWQIADLSTEADLEHSLSPSYTRALVRRGQRGFAAIAAPPESSVDGVLSFGLIWMSYLREREKNLAIEGLAIYVPAGYERSTALRLLCLDRRVRIDLCVYSEEDLVTVLDPADHGNLDTRLEVCRTPEPPAARWADLASLPGVESVPKQDGRVSLRVRGLEFAEAAGEQLRFGLAERTPAAPHHHQEVRRLAEELDRLRSAEPADTAHPLYRQAPEAWLESMVRANPQAIDASLEASPVYGQVPAMAGGERGVLDLLGIGIDGRLAVMEIKATADIHLPLQALDYWVRVKWHLDRGEFAPLGYFPGRAIDPRPPRLLLISPALEFHPSTETVLEYFAPEIEVVRIGLAVEWRKTLRVLFRLEGARRPDAYL